MKNRVQQIIRNVFLSLERHGMFFWAIIGLILIIIVGYIDFLSGFEIAVSLFYLIPISLIVWFAGKTLGVIASAVSAFVWLFAEIIAGQSYSHVGVYFWNMFIPFGFFLIISLLLSALKGMLQNANTLAHTDYLTGAANSRLFFNLLQCEIERSKRYGNSFALAYFDLDDFKKINDQFGHSTGNDVLRTIVNIIRQNIRKTDTIARIGGDEFCLLLLEADQEKALTVVSKIQRLITAEMFKHSWLVTLSIGLLLCRNAPGTADEAIKIADRLMYSAKLNGKNGIRYSIYENGNIVAQL